ncbi:MAG: methionine gamma-lyase family protein, partial [Erysipelotrichaceae bacterium]|nr:methionine gamma-lyase family protein [Erysipelotrichaceae bacterium]
MIYEQIDREILELARKADEDLKEIYEDIDRICLINSDRILSAFIANKVSYSDFADINGYGNYDP